MSHYIDGSLRQLCKHEESQFFLFVLKDGHLKNFIASTKLKQDQLLKISDILLHHNMASICPTLKDVHTIVLSKECDSQLVNHYTLLFSCVTQLVCKNLAKQWIKIIEPYKQTKYPYKFSRKPPWWPSSVSHTEPDHLTKAGRIALLISILRNPAISICTLKDHTKTWTLDEQTQRLLEEMFYISVYDRLFYYEHETNSPLRLLINAEDHMALARKSVILAVSNLRINDRQTLKKRKITKKQMNYKVFRLNEYVKSGCSRVNSDFYIDPTDDHTKAAFVTIDLDHDSLELNSSPGTYNYSTDQDTVTLERECPSSSLPNSQGHTCK